MVDLVDGLPIDLDPYKVFILEAQGAYRDLVKEIQAENPDYTDGCIIQIGLEKSMVERIRRHGR